MAFAIASGLSPQFGIYCAVVTGFLISALGGSRVQIGGPTGAFVVVIAGIIAKHGVDGLFMCTMMAGVLLFTMGATGLGAAVKFIPRPVVLGFTNGIAVLIASTQIKDFLGLRIDHVPGDFIGRMRAIADNFYTISWKATLLGVMPIAVILITTKLVKRLPGYIVALVLGTIAVVLLKLPVETIGTRFGGIPSGPPHLHLPKFHWNMVHGLISPAITLPCWARSNR
jgi:SulP family sulfate permease